MATDKLTLEEAPTLPSMTTESDRSDTKNQFGTLKAVEKLNSTL
jgi:hypothetical protein